MRRNDESRPLLATGSAAPSSQPRSQLSLRERKLKNLSKRVKLRSKRLRAHWDAIAAFLNIQSCVALASTCRRLKALLQDDRVWCVALFRSVDCSIGKGARWRSRDNGGVQGARVCARTEAAADVLAGRRAADNSSSSW